MSKKAIVQKDMQEHLKQMLSRQIGMNGSAAKTAIEKALKDLTKGSTVEHISTEILEEDEDLQKTREVLEEELSDVTISSKLRVNSPLEQITVKVVLSEDDS